MVDDAAPPLYFRQALDISEEGGSEKKQEPRSLGERSGTHAQHAALVG